ncbi:hypothetical protein FOZ63_009788, partial [Perkinsus olseni]
SDSPARGEPVHLHLDHSRRRHLYREKSGHLEEGLLASGSYRASVSHYPLAC